LNQYEEDRILDQINEDTIKTYWNILTTQREEININDIEKKKGFFNPKISVYNLQNLIRLGLISKEHESFKIINEVNVNVLRQFKLLLLSKLPRYIYYLTFFMCLNIFFFSQLKVINFYSVFASIFGFFGTLIILYETLKILIEKY
jgi:hypothetical protein